MNIIATREYYAHKVEYDKQYYAYPVKDKPEFVSLRRRTIHAGNQTEAKQVKRIGEVSRAVKRVMDDESMREAFRRDWLDYYHRRKVSHRDPNIYKHEGRTYSVRTLREYVRAMFYVVNRGNAGELKVPEPTT